MTPFGRGILTALPGWITMNDLPGFFLLRRRPQMLLPYLVPKDHPCKLLLDALTIGTSGVDVFC